MKSDRGAADGDKGGEDKMVRRARLRPWFFTSIFAWSRPIVVLVLSLTFLFIISRGLSLALQGEMSFSSLLAKGRQLALGALLGLSLQARPASAASSSMLLYSASYNGYITTLNLTLSGTSCGGVSGGDGSCNATLKTLEFHDGCWPDPAWLELDKANSVLYCSDEGISARNGSLVSFRTSPLGTLEVLNKVETLKGPVSSVIYGGGKAMALAHYLGSSFSTFSITDPTKLALLYSTMYGMSKPGPNRWRQEAPHPHQAILDPTGKFLLLPDLGADLIRIYALDGTSVKPVAPLEAAPGSGPRHAVFFKTTTGKTIMYVIHELTNNVVGYDVTYPADGASMAFAPLVNVSTHGEGEKAANGATAAEIILSPDNRFLMLSSRYENQFSIPNFNPNNKTQVPSDILVTFSVDQATGALKFLQKFPAGGRVPRHFSINKAGTLVAVGLQDDGRVVIIDRDPASGMLKNIIAHAGDMGEVTCTIFDE